MSKVLLKFLVLFLLFFSFYPDNSFAAGTDSTVGDLLQCNGPGSCDYIAPMLCKDIRVLVGSDSKKYTCTAYRLGQVSIYDSRLLNLTRSESYCDSRLQVNGGVYGIDNALTLSRDLMFVPSNLSTVVPADSCTPGVSTSTPPSPACNIAGFDFVKQAFSNKFPLDIISDDLGSPGGSQCPMFEMGGKSYEMCYLKTLIGGIKYGILACLVLNSLNNL